MKMLRAIFVFNKKVLFVVIAVPVVAGEFISRVNIG